MKLGKHLVVTEMRITSEGNDAIVAHATATYSIPQKKV
jgi:acyl-coenzyme A thioesterase PaaI-like protein